MLRSALEAARRWSGPRTARALALTVAVICVPAGCGESSNDGSDRPRSAEPACVSVPSSVIAVESGWARECDSLHLLTSMSAGDLTGDGVPDVIVNLGGADGTVGVTALDGRDGTHLWHSDDAVLMVTVAPVVDLDGDGAVEVLAAGRGAPEDPRPLVVLDGHDGSLRWRVPPVAPAWQNIYTPQVVPDRDGDAVDDLLIATGGDLVRTAFEPVSVPGRLALLSGSDGSVIGMIDLPDGQETYNSPVVVDSRVPGELDVVVGTGGELLPGSLWRVPISAIEQGDNTRAVRLIDGGTATSFIAPVSVGDLDGETGDDLVALGRDGSVTAVALRDDSTLWSRSADQLLSEPLPAGQAVAALAVPALGPARVAGQTDVVVLLTTIPDEALQGGDVYSGTSELIVLDGATGEVGARLAGPEVGAVNSPLIASVGETPGVVCSCAPVSRSGQSEPAEAASTVAPGLGWWVPGSATVLPIGPSASVISTPLITGDSAPMLVAALRTADLDERSVVTMFRPEIDGSAIDFAPWGGYMGSAGNGHETVG